MVCICGERGHVPEYVGPDREGKPTYACPRLAKEINEARAGIQQRSG